MRKGKKKKRKKKKEKWKKRDSHAKSVGLGVSCRWHFVSPISTHAKVS